jgi:tetratricopeptide (TPR) repeat protein
MNLTPSLDRASIEALREHAFLLHERGELLDAERSYREVLERSPDDLEVMHALGALGIQNRQYESALRLLRVVVRSVQSGPIYADLGNACSGLSRFEEAVLHYDDAIARDPQHAPAHLNRGHALRALGRETDALSAYRLASDAWPHFFEAHAACAGMLNELGQPLDALTAYRHAVALRSNDGNALLGLAAACAGLRRWQEALDAAQRALRFGASPAGAHTLVGLCEAAGGRYEDALHSYGQAICAQSDYVAAHVNRGIALRALGRAAEALECYEAALRIAPDYTEALANRGLILAELDRADEGLRDCERAAALKPGHAELCANRGAVLTKLGRLDEALASYQEAVALRADYAQAHASCAGVLSRLQRPEAALAAAERAVELDPHLAEGLYLRGLALRELGRPREALPSMEAAARLRPSDVDMQFNLGCLRLLLGDLAGGWDLYEWRTKLRQTPEYRRFEQPQWSGEDIDGKALFVYADQGLGDTIQFARYVALAQARGARITLSAQQGLRRLFGRLSPPIEVIDETATPAHFDFHCSLASLPRAFRTTLDTIPAQFPYLSAEPEKIATWRDKLGTHGFKIGVCWRGHSSVGIGRSFPLESLQHLAGLPGVRLISLQKVDGLEQLRALPRGMSVEAPGEHSFDPAPDLFVDTAAVMSLLDLIITCDTSVAHVAGALGRPAWVALKHVADWRWLHERSDSPWYPTLRLFRQSSPGDWHGVFEAMRAALAAQLTSIPEFRA